MPAFINSSIVEGSRGYTLILTTAAGDQFFGIVAGFQITRAATGTMFFVDGGMFTAAGQVANAFSGQILASNLFNQAQGPTGETIFTAN